MTLADVVVVLLVVLAAVAGFLTLGGTALAGRLLGLLAGAGLGLALGIRIAALGSAPGSRWALLAIGVIGGALLGAVLGRLLGRALSGVLVTSRLGVLDRVLGGLAGAATVLVLLWVVVLAAPGLLAPFGGESQLLSAVNAALPDVTAAVQALLSGPR